MKKYGLLLILSIVAVVFAFSEREKVSASMGPGQISWIECYNLPEGYVAGKEDNTSGEKKRISAYTMAPEDTMKPYLTSKYEYDENGNVKFDPSTGGSVDDADAFYYDEHGKLIRSESNVQGVTINWTEYYYDADGYLEKNINYNNDVGQLSTETYEIKDGKIVSAHKVYDGLYYYVMGTHETFSEYTYDRNGNLIRYAISWTNKNSEEKEGSVRTLTYDKYDRLISSTFSYNGGEPVSERYEYDEEGYLARVYKNELCISYLLESAEPEKVGKAGDKTGEQTISVKKQTLTFSFAKLEKKQQSAKIGVKAEGSIKCKKVSGDSCISVTKAGKVKVKKGTPMGIYQIKIRISAGATEDYKAAKITINVSVVVS